MLKIILKKALIYFKYFFQSSELNYNNFPRKINLGSGLNYMNDWINIDNDKSIKADLYCNIQSFHNTFEDNSVDLILSSHSIGYLYNWEAILLFKNSYKLLKDGGVLILEFPDAVKCAKLVLSKNKDFHIEGIRGFHAFDLDQLFYKNSYTPYSYSWTSKFIKEELLKVGFKSVSIKLPLTHNKRYNRDSRIEAYK